MLTRAPWFFLFASTLIACSGGTGSADETVPTPKETGVDLDTGGVEDTGSLEDVGAIDTAPPAPTSCALRSTCDTALPDVGPKRSWIHSTSAAWSVGGARHRGRDLFLLEGQKQWALAKFAYGGALGDKDIHDEDVDVWLLRDCGSSWTKVGTYRTTNDGAHATVEGVEDTGGRIYVDLNKDLSAPLGVGRHRLHFVVGGDLTTTDQIIEVLPSGARIVVSDVDGTLTTSESAAWTTIYGGAPPDANPGAADVLTTLAKRGFYIFYVSARPEWFGNKTQEWLALRKFPPGIVHTTFSYTGATGSSALTFKSGEFAALESKTGITPTYAFGNTDTDRDAYLNAKITPFSNAYFFKEPADTKGGTLHDDYTKLVSGFSTVPITTCPAPAK